MENTKITIDYNYKYNTFKILQSGDYFTATDTYGTYLFLYVDNDCIINIMEGDRVDKDYFASDDEIRIARKLNIVIEE